MSVSPRNRDYTIPPDMHSQVFLRGWSDLATNTGINGGLTTGLWKAIAVDTSGRLAVTIDGLSLSGAQIEVNTDVLESMTASGVRYEASISGQLTAGINVAVTGTANVNSVISNALSSGISGQLAGPLNVTGVTNTGSYSFVNSGITGSQGFIPAGVTSWSAYVESGVASINGITYNTFESIMGGGYDGQKKLGSPIVVGCTGTAAAPCRLILNWEV